MAPPNENIPETGQVNQTKKKTCNNHTCNASARTTATTLTKKCHACMRTRQGQTLGCPNTFDFPRSSRIWFLAIPICVRHPPTVIFRLLTRSNMSCHHKGRCRVAQYLIPREALALGSGSGLWLWALALGSGLLTRHGSSTRPNVGLWRRLALEPQILRCRWGNEIPCAASRGRARGVDMPRAFERDLGALSFVGCVSRRVGVQFQVDCGFKFQVVAVSQLSLHSH